ncbi:MAG: dTMP kinase [Bdellovibrionales bacterium]|nr:dTMP kinase [Bdellovibrionales bacterium]
MAFLAFEGIDGSGKTTLIQSLSKILKKQGIPLVITREPGGTEVGQEIRALLLKKRLNPPLPSVETLLYYADRKQNVDQVIQPALKEGKWVLSDRYWASTSAFQCGGRGESEALVNLLREKICGECQPDLWILLDLPVEQSLKRLNKFSRSHLDRFESEDREFHQKIRDYYLKLSHENQEKWLILDATEPSSEILSKLLTHLERKKILK